MARVFQANSLVSILQLGQLLDSLPSIEKSGLKIFGYPEFAFTVNTLKPDQQKKIDDLAAKIVASQSTNQPIRGVSIFGHADLTLRESKGNGARTELEVSSDRADAAKEALTDAIHRRGGDKVLGKIHIRAKGVGSAFREVIPARTEEEMKRNRRVEFFVVEVILPAPAPPQPPVRPPAPEPGKKWTAQILSGTMTSESLTLSSLVSVNVEIEIVDVLRNLKATFICVAGGNGLPGASLGLLGVIPVSTAVLTKKNAVPFDTTGVADLKFFSGRIAILVDPGAAAFVFSTDSFFRMSFEGMEKNLSIFTKPSAVPLEAGTRFDTAPQFGLGAVVHGALILKKGPSPL